MFWIPLTRGQFSIVDDDFDWLSRSPWYAKENVSTQGFYAARTERIDGRAITIRMHRVVMDAAPDQEVDHINRNTLDNRRENLRFVTRSESSINRGMRSDSTSGYRGVSWNKRQNMWRAYIGIDGQQIHLGYFRSKDEAARAYDMAAIKYHGPFAQLNFPAADYARIN